MHFDRYGRTYQLRLKTADDLAQVPELDVSHWIALSAPVAGLNCDREFLDFVDVDNNQRIRTDEITGAVRYLLERLADPSQVCKGTDRIGLAWIDASHPHGQQLLDTAEYILEALGNEDARSVDLDCLETFRSWLSGSVINGDGIITPVACETDRVRQFVKDVIARIGGREDLTGRVGIGEADMQDFLSEARAYLEWISAADLPDGEEQKTDVMPLGSSTHAAFSALEAVRRKVDDFFLRCHALQFGHSSGVQQPAGALSQPLDEFGHFESLKAHLEDCTLAPPTPEAVLDLGGPLNPVYVDRVRALQEMVLEPVLGGGACLEPQQWEQVKALFAPHQAWLSGKKGASVEGLDRSVLRSYLGDDCVDAVRQLLARDRDVARRLEDARELKRLLLYHKLLLPLVNNFVSFPDLYHGDRRALFEMGSLVVDGRWFNFAVRVDNRSEHAELARSSGMYVMYVELTQVAQDTKLTVAVPATSGTVGNLGVGKRGIFYDTAGRHYDARVVQIIENPISFREALFAPFVRLGRFVAGKIEAMSGLAQKELEGKVGRMTDQVQAGVQQTVREGPQLAPPPSSGQTATDNAARAATSRRDLLVGASVSIAALSSAFAYVTGKLSEMMGQPRLLAYAVLALVLVVSVPTALAAAIKLSRRDLSSILEGCGWAINARMRLNRRQRHQFTQKRAYPDDATGTPKRRTLRYLLLALLLAAATYVVVRHLRV